MSLNQEEYDSDLDGNHQQFIIHGANDTSTTIIRKSSKKRTFDEMENDDNHYTSKHSNNKLQKLDHSSNNNLSLNSFLNDSDSDSDSDIDNSDDQDSDIVVNADSSLIQMVEFEMEDIYEYYYHEIKDIIASTDWDQTKLKVTKLTDIIVKQEEIGGVLTCSKSVLGFITLLSFNKYFEHLSLAHIRRFLVNKCSKISSKKKKLENYFNNKNINIGLLLHERPINMSLELIPFVYESLYKDIEYAINPNKAKHLNKKECDLFKCDYILMIVRYRWFPINDDDDNDDQILLPHLLNRPNNMRLIHEHLEDDLFVKKADFQFDFERNDKIWNILLVKMSHFKDIIQTMKELFSVQ